MNNQRGIPGSPGNWWSAPQFVIEGHELSLEDIEMNILARHWQGDDGNPTWVYGLTWGTRGSPPLPLEAFSGVKSDKQLADVARKFINKSTNVSVGRSGVQLSSLYQWHGNLFGGTDEAILAHIGQFAKEPLKMKLANQNSISRYSFNWRTNSFVPDGYHAMPETIVQPEHGP